MGVLEDIEAASRRDRLGPRTTRIEVGGYLRVAEHPFALADKANMDLNPRQPDRYALARMVHAEEGSSSVIEKLCVCEAVVNRAKERGISPYSVITYDRRRELWGFFGEQSGRYCASGGSADPNQQDGSVVLAITAGEITLVRNATKFFAPRIRRQRGKELKSRERIVTDWAREGFQWIGPLDGLDAGDLMLLSFRGRFNADPRPALNFFKTRFASENDGRA